MSEATEPERDNGGTTERQDVELQKLKYETTLARIEVGLWRRFLRSISLLAPIFAFGALFLGLAQIAVLQHNAEQKNLRALLKDIGSSETPTRSSAISRLTTYQNRDSLFDYFMSFIVEIQPQGETNKQIVSTVKHALWLETSPPVKVAMIDLLESRYKQEALGALQKLRIDLIRQLKHENSAKEQEYWNNMRDTLLRVAISISNIAGKPPDFTCFPLKGVTLRQIVLKDDADFSGASLPFSEIWGGRLRGANFKDANLYGATLKHLDLDGASFEGADLRNAKLGPDIDGLMPEMFRESNWRAADWEASASLFKQLDAHYEPSEGTALAVQNREEFCTDLLNEEFEVQ